MNQDVREYLRSIGRKGGKKSRRRLDPETAREMVRVREARRAFRRHHLRCFWFCDPDYRVGKRDIAWVAEQLRRHGGREEWYLAAKLCR